MGHKKAITSKEKQDIVKLLSAGQHSIGNCKVEQRSQNKKKRLKTLTG